MPGGGTPPLWTVASVLFVVGNQVMRRARLLGILLVTGTSWTSVVAADAAGPALGDSTFRVISSRPVVRQDKALGVSNSHTKTTKAKAASPRPKLAEPLVPSVQMVADEETDTAPTAEANSVHNSDYRTAQALSTPQVPPVPKASDAAAGKSDAELVPTPVEGAVTGRVLTLDDAIHMALEANPTVGQSLASVNRLRGERRQSGYYPNPVGGYVASEVGNDGKAGQQGIYFGQTIVTADKLGWNRAVAAGGVAFAQAQAEAQRLRVLTDTSIRFYEALGNQQLVEIAQKVQTNAQQGFDATSALVRAGEAARADELQAETVLERANVGVAQAQARAEGSWRRLAAVLGQPHLGAMTLVGDLDQGIPAQSFDVVWQQLCASSPELMAASAHIERTRARIGREHAQAVPDVDAQSMVQFDTATNYTVVGIQVGMPIPVHHQNEGAIAAAQAEHIRACREYERVELSLRDRLAQTIQEVEVARAQVETYREKVLPAATESLELVRRGYQQGEFDVLRLITSQQIYADASAQLVQALIDLRSAESRVSGLLLTGGLDEPVAPEPVGGLGGLADVPHAE